jgi:hypothetical protein
MPRKRGRRKASENALAIVRQARAAAKSALDSLREEIKATAARLQKLITEERSFKFDLFGGVTRRARGAAGRRKAARRGRPPKRARASRRKGTPLAERFFSKLPRSFTLDEVRKIAGSKAGISLAQWSRAKRIRKTAAGYQKTAA